LDWKTIKTAQMVTLTMVLQPAQVATTPFQAKLPPL
jgi:hypothetical protein